MSDKPLPRPENLDEMLSVAKDLAADFESLVRIDMYRIDEKIMIGEITNISGNAQAQFIPPQGEQQAAKLLFG